MKFFSTLFLVLLATVAFSQTFSPGTNTSISACSGTFNDSGGAGGSYGINQNYTVTICPTTPGSKVQLNFTSFATENSYDFLYVYDGNTTAAPSLGAYTGTSGPGLVQATAGNASGCITIRFTSDGSTTAAGWIAAISCVVPCETINSVFNSSTPAPGAGGIIKSMSRAISNI